MSSGSVAATIAEACWLPNENFQPGLSQNRGALLFLCPCGFPSNTQHLKNGHAQLGRVESQRDFGSLRWVRWNLSAPASPRCLSQGAVSGLASRSGLSKTTTKWTRAGFRVIEFLTMDFGLFFAGLHLKRERETAFQGLACQRDTHFRKRKRRRGT